MGDTRMIIEETETPPSVSLTPLVIEAEEETLKDSESSSTHNHGSEQNSDESKKETTPSPLSFISPTGQEEKAGEQQSDCVVLQHLTTDNTSPDNSRNETKGHPKREGNSSPKPPLPQSPSSSTSTLARVISSPLPPSPKKQQLEKKFSDNQAIEDFFIAWEEQATGWGNFFTSSVWDDKYMRGAIDTITCEDLIWHAKKTPPNGFGIGGNRTAKILFSKFRMNVSKSSEKQDPDSDTTFQAALKNVELEKDAIKITPFSSTTISWKGINPDESRLIEIIRHIRKQPNINEFFIVTSRYKIDLFKNATEAKQSKTSNQNQRKLTDRAEQAALEANTREDRMVDLIINTMKLLDKEAELIDKLSTIHQRKLSEDKKKHKASCYYASRTGLKLEDKQPYQTSLASFIDYGKRSIFSWLISKRGFFYSGKRTYNSLIELEEKLRSSNNLDNKKTSLMKSAALTPKEISDSFVQLALQEEKRSKPSQ